MTIRTPSPAHLPIPSARNISVTAPINDAFRWTRWILFEDFDLGKWFVLGFCAFLANLSEGGGSSFSFNPGGGLDREAADTFPFPDILNFLYKETVLIIIIGLVVFALILGAILLVTWLSSRGKFMFLDGIVHNRARMTEPWHRFRKAGEDLFITRMFLFIAGGVLSLIVMLIGFVMAWGNIQARVWDAGAVIAIIFSGIFLFALLIAFLLIHAVLSDFVVLIMYHRDLSAVAAIKYFRNRFLKGHIGSFILFYLMKLVLAIGIGMVILIGGCLTCCFLYCITALPYLGSVLLLPVSVFMRYYDIFFFRQFGEEADLFQNG